MQGDAFFHQVGRALTVAAVFVPAPCEARRDAHEFLDSLGMIPGVGDGADLTSGLLYLTEGDYLGAGLSLAATLPYLGSAPGAVKLARHVDVLPGGVAREAVDRLHAASRDAIENHHLLPKEFVDKFVAAGFSIEEYKLLLRRDDHRLKSNGIHTGQDNWNRAWEDFYDEYKDPRPENALHRRAGRRLSDLSVVLPRLTVEDVVWTYYGECLVQNRVVDLFRRLGFTGYERRPVRARFNQLSRAAPPELWELWATGWGGMAPPKSGVKVVDHCKVCKSTVYSSCSTLAQAFDKTQWDGSDFFFVWPLPKYIWVTERVAQYIRRHKLKGVRLRPPEQVVFRMPERGFGFSPARLSYYLPEARAKELGEALGID